MKFLLAAALISTAYSQEILTSDGEVISSFLQPRIISNKIQNIIIFLMSVSC